MDTTDWTPFFFDANPAFGRVQDESDWRALVEKLAAGWGDAWNITLDRALLQARMAVDIPLEYMGPFPTVPTDIPSFGFRREHTGAVTLNAWALTHDMDLRKVAGRAPFALRLGESWLLGFAHGSIPTWAPQVEEAARYGSATEAQWVVRTLGLPCTVERLPP